MAEPFNIDTPVTDLDEQNDHEMLGNEPLEQLGVLDEDYEAYKGNKGFVSKIKDRFMNNRKGVKYQKVNDNIELQDYNQLGSILQANREVPLNKVDSEFVPKSRVGTKVGFIICAIGFVTMLVSLSVKIANDKNLKATRFSRFKPRLNNGSHEFYPTTIMISLDGFHPHYISREITPYLHNLYLESYGPPYMVPSFPSSTFPNHWSMVTGLYPSSHGIVGNTFFDVQTGKQFVNVNASLSMELEWWGGEPVWTTAYKNGVSCAVHMWPGSEVDFKTGNPLEVDGYNGSEILSKKVSRLAGWLDRDIDSRPELMLSYAPIIDSLGHKYGISGRKLKGGLRYVDNFIESVMVEIQSRNLLEIVNVVVVSDHGMAPTSNERLIYLDDYVNLAKIQHIDGWPLYGLRPFEAYSVEEVYQEIAGKLTNHSHFQLYLKRDFPKEWHFGGPDSAFDSRIAPIWLVPDVGYSITTIEQIEIYNGNYRPKGVHGYNNTEVLMRALFLATGPYFRETMGQEKKVRPFENVEVYSIVCGSLNISAESNNSTGLALLETLDPDWKDGTTYPGVDIDAEYIMANSTYDELYRNGKSNYVVVPSEPSKSLLSTEKEIGTSITPEAVPAETFVGSSSSTAVEDATATEAAWGGFLEDAIDAIKDEAKEIFDSLGDAVAKVVHRVDPE